jgi:hypothetical protein
MYETDDLTVNQGKVKVCSQVGNDVSEAPQGGAIRWRNRMTTRSQQPHHRSKVCPPAPPDVKAQIRHAPLLAQIQGGTVMARARPHSSLPSLYMKTIHCGKAKNNRPTRTGSPRCRVT